VEIHPMMYVALSYDHRIIDGKESVGFLVAIKEALESPMELLLDNNAKKRLNYKLFYLILVLKQGGFFFTITKALIFMFTLFFIKIHLITFNSIK
jgi:hypothetical protein